MKLGIGATIDAGSITDVREPAVPVTVVAQTEKTTSEPSGARSGIERLAVLRQPPNLPLSSAESAYGRAVDDFNAPFCTRPGSA